jgi:hypothetical protein
MSAYELAGETAGESVEASIRQHTSAYVSGETAGASVAARLREHT